MWSTPSLKYSPNTSGTVNRESFWVEITSGKFRRRLSWRREGDQTRFVSNTTESSRAKVVVKQLF